MIYTRLLKANNANVFEPKLTVGQSVDVLPQLAYIRAELATLGP